jgi:hypothetical protein
MRMMMGEQVDRGKDESQQKHREGGEARASSERAPGRGLNAGWHGMGSDFGQKLVEIERLLQHVGCGQTGSNLVDGVLCRQDDDLNAIDLFMFEPAVDLPSIHHGHMKVEEQEARLLPHNLV